MSWRQSPKGYRECVVEPWLAFTIARTAPLASTFDVRVVVRPSKDREMAVASASGLRTTAAAEGWARRWWSAFLSRHANEMV